MYYHLFFSYPHALFLNLFFLFFFFHPPVSFSFLFISFSQSCPFFFTFYFSPSFFFIFNYFALCLFFGNYHVASSYVCFVTSFCASYIFKKRENALASMQSRHCLLALVSFHCMCQNSIYPYQ